MKVIALVLAGIGLVAACEAKPRVAILNAQRAVLSTDEGKAAAAEFQRKFGLLESQLSPEAFRQQVEEEQRRILKGLNDKLLPIVESYAKQKHFEVVLDESDPRTPVYWRAKGTDITDEIVKRYNLAARKK
jgi:Skp family chaperone for outer membrane proteins